MAHKESSAAMELSPSATEGVREKEGEREAEKEVV